jgi:Heterokaryon incompatibility protein (HET)
MLCNAVHLPITQNLAAALQEIQHPTETVHPHADAVCINQSNEQEKAEHVAKMLQIYQRSSCTTAWLGAADMDSISAVLCIGGVSALGRKLEQAQGRTHSSQCLIRLKRVHVRL